MKKLMCAFLMLLPMCCLAQSNKPVATANTKLPLEDQNALLKAARSVSDAERMVDVLKDREKSLFQQIVQKNNCTAGISYDLDCLHQEANPQQPSDKPSSKK